MSHDLYLLFEDILRLRLLMMKQEIRIYIVNTQKQFTKHVHFNLHWSEIRTKSTVQIPNTKTFFGQ